MQKHILIIDDDDLIQAVAELVLGSVPGWTLKGALTGEEGLSLATTSPPDLILLDWVLPGMEGPAVLEKLAENPATQNVPVIMLTAMSGEEAEREAAQLGAIGIVSKPFEPDTLAERISFLMDWS
ncbi:Stage 0 sporulation protein A [compost metagenome]